MRQPSVAAIPCGVLCSCPWNVRSRIGVAVFCQVALVSFGRACVAWVTAAPARRAAATIAASTISASVAPALRALPLWMSMQYGHCVVRATATAISSLYFTGIAPSATAALSKAQKAFITCGARLSIFFSLARFSLLYIWVIVGSERWIRSISHCNSLEILGSDFGRVGSCGDVVGGLKFNQVAPQRGLAGLVERGERPLSRAVVLAEEFDRFGGRERVTHQ